MREKQMNLENKTVLIIRYWGRTLFRENKEIKYILKVF